MAWTTATHDTNYDREDSFGSSSFFCHRDEDLYTWGSPTTTYYTRIVDLDYRGGNGNRGVCVMLSNRALPTSGAFSTSYCYPFSTSSMSNTYIKAYNFSNQVFTSTSSIYTTSGKKTYAIHSRTTSSSGQPQLKYCVFGTGTSSTEYAYTKTSSGIGNGGWTTRTWRPNDDGSESYFASITSTSTASSTSVTSISMSAGYHYTFKMHTNSYPGKEGIVISGSRLPSPNVTSSGVARCSGIDVLQTYTTEPTSSGTMWIHFRMDGDGFAGYGLSSSYNSSTHQYTTTSASGWAVGDVEVIRRRVTTITLNDNGGSGGSGTTKGYVGLPLDNVNVPTRSGSNGSFQFLGYWDTSAISGGTQYYNAAGSSVRNWDKTGTTATLYARWRNSLIYTRTATTFNIYTTTDDDTAPTTTVGTRELTLFSNLYASVGSVSYTMHVVDVDNPDSDLATINGWSFSPSTKKLTIPAGTYVTRYSAEIILTTNANSGTSSYVGDRLEDTFLVTVIRTAASGYSDVTGLTYEQLNDFPAGSFTLSQSNLSTYFRGKNAHYNQLYNNGYSEPSTSDIVYTFVGSIASGGQTQSYTSLGTTPTSRSTVSINQGYLIIMARHGSSYQTVTITSAYREANSVTLTMTLGSNTITYNGETTVTVVASYSSGSIETDVTSSASMSLQPTGIVSIS